MPAERQNSTTGPAAHPFGHPLAASEQSQMAGCPGGARPPGGGRPQIFIRWARAGVWERLLNLVQECGVELGMVFLDGTSVRAHHKAAGASRKGDPKLSEMIVKHLAALVEAMAPRLAWSLTLLATPSRFGSRLGRHMNCPMPSHCWSNCRVYRCEWSGIAATPAMPFASTSGAWAHDPLSRRSATRRRWFAPSGSGPD